MKRFLMLLKTYYPKKNVTIEANERALTLFTTTLNVSDYIPDVKPPARFIVGSVTDTWVPGGDK